MLVPSQAKLRMYRLRARRWTREIAVATALTIGAAGFIGAAVWRSGQKTVAVDAVPKVSAVKP